MKNTIKRFLLVAAFGVISVPAALVACAAPQATSAPQNLAGPTEPLTIVSGDKTHAFKVELADTPAETEMGLMYRASMPRDQGMIFDFGTPRETSMWMKNCLFPQDMLFIDASGKVLAIVRNARPGSEALISPGVVVKSVLELNGGVAKELGIKPGDKVQHRIFGATAAAGAGNGG